MKHSFNFRELLTSKIEFNEYNVFCYALFGIVGHPLFWFLWTYIDPQPYESICLRGFGFLICLILFTTTKWNRSLEKYAHYYWVFAITYNLPFLFTVFLINNNFNQIWLSCEIIMIMIVIFSTESFFYSLLIACYGIILAILFCGKFYPDNAIHNPIIIENIPVILFAISASTVFSYSNAKGISVKKEIKHQNAVMMLKSFAGSIAHEIRNPLNTINLIGGQIGELLRKDIKYEKSENETKEQLINLTSKISEAIKGANNIINIILSDLSDKPINQNDFCYLEPRNILSEIVDKYGYKNEPEREKVKLDQSLQEYNFVFKSVPDRFTFIIYNLLKNALYYLKDYPNSIVTVGIEKKSFEGKNYNIIYVQDTGPGISEDSIPRLFEDFYTSGKKDGTGLGLSFCKRNMLLFGGDIICDSELGKWTKFSLLFPEVSEEELKKKVEILTEAKKKKILIVDDEETNLLIEKNILEKSLNIICDTANNGHAAVKLFKENIDEYESVLMDLEMPVMDGFKAISEIRGLNSNVPIIAYSSLKDAQEKASKAGANEYIIKPVKKELLTKIISKWIDKKYDLLNDKSLEEVKAILQNKRILLADDEATNRLMLAKYIGNFGAFVDKVDDGGELVKKFKESTVNKSAYDLIISDINMPTMTGDEATKEIRKYEREKNLKSIPIIAFTGDNDMKKLLTLFNVGMTDYVIKGDNNESILRALGFWLYFKEDYWNHHL